MEMMNESSDDMMDESPSEEIQEMNDETTMNEESMDESMMEEEEVMKEA
jgi:hypothetical protein